MTIADELYRLGHFQYAGNFYPLAGTDVNYFNIEIHTTFGLRKTIVVTAEASKEGLSNSELLGLSGFVAFELEVPFDWTDISNRQREDELSSDDDVSICTDYHQFATKQFVKFVERKQNLYRIQAGWVFDEDSKMPATVDGWFSFYAVVLHVEDKIFGEERRSLHKKYGEEVPTELENELDERIKESAWKLLCELSPDAKSHYEDPKVQPGNYCIFKPFTL